MGFLYLVIRSVWKSFVIITKYCPTVLAVNVFMGQIGPFINMNSRRTVSNDPIPIKNSLSQGDIFRLKITRKNTDYS